MDCNCSKIDNKNKISDVMLEKTKKHPCYSVDAHNKFARMHLPVAPNCNISCNYCNRKFDCVNESRPGVTSEILTPKDAKIKFDIVKEKIGELSVVGIAGPGDALENWDNTKKSIELIRVENPDIVFCLSTNGLMLPRYAQEIIQLGVTHVTVTVNCLDNKIGAKIYKYVNYKGKQYALEVGAKLLLENQLKGIKLLTSQGIIVKINIVMLEGINDHHIPDVVKKMKELGVFIINIMPLIPAQGSVFENHPQTKMKELTKMRDICELDVQQMRHCKQCRADAIGMLCEDRSQEFSNKIMEDEVLEVDEKKNVKKLKVAVTSKNGRLVDLHYGHAKEFMIYEINGSNFSYIETRAAEKYCLGIEECDEEEARRDAAVNSIADCDVVLTLRIGDNAEKKLLLRGIRSVIYWYTIEQGLKLVQKEMAN
ncbi:MAG TPA: nitrogenase cofactor biosynthesis protein NifB [Ruminiclostridium sp.]